MKQAEKEHKDRQKGRDKIFIFLSFRLTKSVKQNGS